MSPTPMSVDGDEDHLPIERASGSSGNENEDGGGGEGGNDNNNEDDDNDLACFDPDGGCEIGSDESVGSCKKNDEDEEEKNDEYADAPASNNMPAMLLHLAGLPRC